MVAMTGLSAAHVVDQDRKGPGRPRSARADEAIVEAVLELLAEGHTIDALSIEAVATRAGVGKATIYRRWANKEALIVDAVVAMKGPVPPIGGESVREDLVTLVAGARKASSQRAGKVTMCLLPELHRNPQMHERYQELVEPRRQAMREVLQRGVTTGEIRADVDIELTLLMLTGPMLAQSMLRWNPKLDTANLAERLVDTLLAGIGPTC
jgi:AcrR family transcriptional regulator